MIETADVIHDAAAQRPVILAETGRATRTFGGPTPDGAGERIRRLRTLAG